MKERLNFRQLIAVASMLFGLFFGAGNLIFPVHMGQLAGANSYIAALGFIVTAVGLPLIGVAAFGISRSDQFVRPAMMPRYDCEDEADSEGPNNAEDENFFD